MVRSKTTALPRTGLRPPLWNTVVLAGGNGLQGASCEPHSKTNRRWASSLLAPPLGAALCPAHGSRVLNGSWRERACYTFQVSQVGVCAERVLARSCVLAQGSRE
jgi:hypothetical protein